MEFLLAMIFVACLYFLIAKRKSAQPPINQQNLQSHSGENSDDFAGQSIGSVFLMEEFVDPRTPGRHSADAKLLHDHQTFESEFEEEGWDEEDFLTLFRLGVIKMVSQRFRMNRVIFIGTCHEVNSNR